MNILKVRVPRMVVWWWLFGTSVLCIAYQIWGQYNHRSSAIMGFLGAWVVLELMLHIDDGNSDWLKKWDTVQTAGFWVCLVTLLFSAIGLAAGVLT